MSEKIVQLNEEAIKGQLSRNRIRVKERDGKSETGKGRES